MNVRWLAASAWLDDDGEHVWVRHECTDGPLETMLPWPTWRAVQGRVSPSVHCLECGLHDASLEITNR